MIYKVPFFPFSLPFCVFASLLFLILWYDSCCQLAYILGIKLLVHIIESIQINNIIWPHYYYKNICRKFWGDKYYFFFFFLQNLVSYPAAAAAKSLQSCLTLCDPTDGSPLGSSVPGILQAKILEWVAISFSNAWKWKKWSRSVVSDS